ncbi:MAG: hypothetical protein IJ010_05445 [Ruminococcus sp.]|nr:hypothetical protein [Ruminococcus sp.]
MAFCKHCGTQYPDGGSCTNPECPGAQQAAAPTNSALDGGFNEAMEKVKKNSGVIIGAVIAFIALVIVIVFIGGHTGAKGAANKYAKNMYKKSGFKSVSKVSLLDDAYKEYKKSDEFDDDKDEFKEMIDNMKDNDVKFKVKSVKKGKKLKKDALKGAEVYFEEQADEFDVDDDIDVKKGYEFKIKVKMKADGESKTTTQKICVVKVKGNGWKVIPESADSLSFDEDDFDYDDFDFDF